jgi:hypothetical protein
MKDVADIIVTQVRVYEPDNLPFQALRLPSNLRAFARSYSFSGAAVDPLGLQLTLANGMVEIGKRAIHVLNLILEPRRMVLQIQGRTSDANAAAESFSAELAKLVPDPKREKLLQPILVNDETACVATLDIDFSDLFASPLAKLVEGEAKRMLSDRYVSAKSISFKNLSFEVRYDPADSSLEEHEVGVVSKALTIEPRLGASLQERRFFVSSPTDSETHLALMGILESEISKSRGTNR